MTELVERAVQEGGEIILDEEAPDVVETADDPVTQIGAIIKAADSKAALANITVTLAYEENGAPNVTIKYNTIATEERRRRLEGVAFPKVVNGVTIDGGDTKLNCTLALTEYGDMSSFVGHLSKREGSTTFLPTSTGYSETVADSMTGTSGTDTYSDTIKYSVDIVEKFPCEGNTSSGMLSLNTTDLMTTDLGGLAGRGILLKIAGTHSIIGYSVIAPDNGVPKADVVIKDVIAVCQDPGKLSLMIYSDQAAVDQTLQAHFQPQTLDVIEDYA